MSTKVALFATCLADQFWPEVAAATVKVLERAGCTVTFDARQTCCGQPAFNSGYRQEAKAVARHWLDVFAAAQHIVMPSGSCAAMVHRYEQLFADEPDQLARAHELIGRTHELAGFLVRVLGVSSLGARFPGKVALHDSCHGLRELGQYDEPRRLLRAVSGLDLVEFPNGATCCGFGGTFAVKFPELSTAMADHRLAGLTGLDVDTITAVDASCLLQLRGRLQRTGSKVRVLHLAEILAS